METSPTELPEVLEILPQIHQDPRGFFYESYQEKRYNKALGGNTHFKQDNISHSSIGVLRGLHFQQKYPQGKLIQCLSGEIFDVIVDIRKDSPNFGKWVSHTLTGDKKKQIWCPPGFAHGFLTISTSATVLYKCTEFYFPDDQKCLNWADETVAIRWPKVATPLTFSKKDSLGLKLNQLN